jgi:phage terminase Nu1 subunit (DNA packaging protein)
MTYKQLFDKLQQIPSERLNDDVTVWDYWADEFVAVANLTQNKKDSKQLDTNVLDYGHFVLELKN